MTTKTTKISGDLINVDTIKVTRSDLRQMERDAKADRLERLMAEGACAFALLDSFGRESLVTLVDRYRSTGEPMAVAVRDKLVTSGRQWCERMAKGEKTASGRYVGESQWTRACRIVDNWPQGESTADVVARFTSESEVVGITEFVRWIGGGASKPKVERSIDAVLAAAVRSYIAKGGSVADAVKIAKSGGQ
jgi:hypothetical protein